MGSPLIRTKFHMPRPRRGIVTRPRLDDILGRAAEARLTVVSAPAGFGKTTLLASWLAGPHAGQPCVAWLSLTEGDGDPTTFWPYVVGALQNAVPGIGPWTAEVYLLFSAGHPDIFPARDGFDFTTKAHQDRVHIGGGASYVDLRYANTENTVWIPSYWRFDMMASVRVGSRSIFRRSERRSPCLPAHHDGMFHRGARLERLVDDGFQVDHFTAVESDVGGVVEGVTSGPKAGSMTSRRAS